jgi:hypothetical protein
MAWCFHRAQLNIESDADNSAQGLPFGKANEQTKGNEQKKKQRSTAQHPAPSLHSSERTTEISDDDEDANAADARLQMVCSRNAMSGFHTLLVLVFMLLFCRQSS